MTQPEYEPLYSLITNRTGLLLDENRQENVRRVIAALNDAGDVSGPAALAQELAHTPFTHRLWQQVLEVITIGETYFFRNQAHFNALREQVLPELIARRRAQGTLYLRLWSAGCATGEEAYSLAMLLHDLLPDRATWHISILGTDISLGNLERARRGLYRPWSFRSETPPDLQARWFTPAGDHVELDPAIRRMVTFAP
ncbi:MAG: protein-glutamate O-methyltransferase, partial [Anaerolineae bacterium]|nr:protein-glutamate O-methyltransferase [Anaerolineae bacterium]